MSKRPIVARLNAITIPMAAKEREILSSINAEIIELEGASDKEILEKCMDADAIMIISTYLRTDVLRQLKNLKLIARLGTGVDKIDVEEATRQGIIVTNLPDFCTEEVADHTMALLLCVARKLKENEILMREGKRPDSVSNMHRLSVLTLGIIGFGRIGRAFAKRAKGFGMRILVHDPMLSDKEASVEGMQSADLNRVLSESDYLCLLCPLTPDTREMIKMEQLKKMKDNAVLVNTGRGELIREADLVEALNKEIIRYAALDVFGGINVFTENGFPTDHPFFNTKNILLSPHVGANSEEAAENSITGGSQAVVQVLTGNYPSHIVNPSVQPRMKFNSTQNKVTVN